MIRSYSAFAIFALCLAIALRALVPAGYMLDRSEESGTLEVRICSGTNAEAMSFMPASGQWVSLNDQAPDQDADRENMPPADSICPFALAHIIAQLPQVSTDLLPPLFGPPLLGGKIYLETSFSRPAAPPLPARGPPLHI